ncbi:tyrosine-type recombinase/integrase [Salmonella enterica]|nr:tyrosine-type recombinase/integrase [Salmonella enterica]
MTLALMMTCQSAMASLAADQTRYIFRGDKDALTITVTNNDKERTFGGQAWVDNIVEKDTRPTFVVTPSFFKVKPNGQQTHRLVPLSDTWYVSQLQTMVATLKIPMERRNKRTGRTEKAQIWEVTDRTVRTWIGEAVAAAAADGVTFSVPVTPHTFRHSYAMHMLYAGIPLKVLQSLMGHKSISSTEVYTKVFALDVAARHRVRFSMPESDAVTMLKNRHA